MGAYSAVLIVTLLFLITITSKNGVRALGVCSWCDSRSSIDCLEAPTRVRVIQCPGGPCSGECGWKVEYGVLHQSCACLFDNFTVVPGFSGTCEEYGCFQESFLANIICYSCNSKENPNCVGNPKENGIFPEICGASDDSCIWKIEDHVLYRGCKSSFDGFIPEEGISGECKDSRCNNGVYNLGV